MPKTLIENAHILTLDESLNEFDKSYLVNQDDRNEDVGTGFAGPKYRFGYVADASHKFITLGFIFAHDRESNYLAAPRRVDGHYGPSYTFIWRLMAFNIGWTERHAHISSLVGALHYIQSGVTTALDFYLPFNFDVEFVDWMAMAYDVSGLRAVMALCLFDESRRAVNVIPPGLWHEVMPFLSDYVRPRPLSQIRETPESSTAAIIPKIAT